MKLREIEAPDAPKAPTYAQAVEVTAAERLLFISGQIGVDVDGKAPPDFAAQAKLAWHNILAQLAAADMTIDNLVQVRIFLADRKYTEAYRAARDEVFGGRRIGLTCIVCDIFDADWLMEIEAVAAA